MIKLNWKLKEINLRHFNESHSLFIFISIFENLNFYKYIHFLKKNFAPIQVFSIFSILSFLKTMKNYLSKNEIILHIELSIESSVLNQNGMTQENINTEVDSS
jgi:hypothetical protein